MPLSGAQGALAAEWLDSGRPAVVPRPAATVMLVRDAPVESSAASARRRASDARAGPGDRGRGAPGDRGPAGGVEVFVQRRVASMAFAPSTYVFPGGAVDDVDARLPPDAPGVAELAAAMGVSAAEAARRAASAVREVAEECGVTLVVAELRARGHWVTPEFEPRRFDTWILAARMPPGQVAHTASGESDTSEWVLPADLLARHAAGEAPMLPPTVVSLRQVARFGDVAGLLSNRPRVIRVEPRLVRGPGTHLALRTHLG